MIKTYIINYKGYHITYIPTNLGNLFVARTLISVLKEKQRAYWDTRRYVSDVNKIKVGEGEKAPVCVGLNGFRQIFADKPDEELEQLLISYNIVKGDLPSPDSLKILFKTTTPKTSYYTAKTEALHSKIQELQKENEQLKQRNEYYFGILNTFITRLAQFSEMNKNLVQENDILRKQVAQM